MGKKCFLVILNYILIFFVFLICENGKKKLGHQVFLFCFVFLYETGRKKVLTGFFFFFFLGRKLARIFFSRTFTR